MFDWCYRGSVPIFLINQYIFNSFGRPLSLKCYAVPARHQKECDSLSTSSSCFSTPENGKRPVFASNQDLHTSSQAEPRFQFTRVPSCKKFSGAAQQGVFFARKIECWLDEKPGPLMQPRRDWKLRKTAAAGERKREGAPKRNMAYGRDLKTPVLLEGFIRLQMNL